MGDVRGSGDGAGLIRFCDGQDRAQAKFIAAKARDESLWFWRAF